MSIFLVQIDQLDPFCNDWKVLETIVLHKPKLPWHGCTEPIYKPLPLVDHHICFQGSNKYIYIHLYNTEMPIKPKQNFANMKYLLYLNMNILLQHKIRQ